MQDRLSENVEGDRDPNDRHDVPSRHGEDFEVGGTEQASGSRDVPAVESKTSVTTREEAKEKEGAPRLVNLLEVEGLGEIRIPHLHDQRSIQVEELVVLPISLLVRVRGLPPILVLEIWVRDRFSRNDPSNLVLVQDLVRRV